MSTNKQNNLKLIEKIGNEILRDINSIKIIQCDDEYAEIYEDRVGSNIILTDKYWNPKEMSKLNNNLEIWKFRGFRFNDYIELLVDFNLHNLNVDSSLLLKNFYIGDVYVSVETPSFIFDTLSSRFYHDIFYEYKKYCTISLKGINSDNYEDYLSKALFILGTENPSYITEPFPTCYKFLGESIIDDQYVNSQNFIAKRENNPLIKFSFKDMKYAEPIAFFNEGKRLRDSEGAFLYFYKVLEYFFFICRKEDIKVKIDEYNIDKNLDNFLQYVNDKLRIRELEQLHFLINLNWEIINPMLKNSEFFNRDIIENSKNFSKELYNYRNQLIHGKSELNYIRKTPKNLGASKEEEWWNTITEKIANIIIRKYCFL